MGFIIDETPYAGGKESERVFCMRANNPSPMTYTGTNTWVLAEAASPECIVIDPAPAGEHVQNVLNACIEQGLRVGAVVCTHMHADHTEGAEELADISGARVYAPFDGTLLPGEFCPIENGPALRVVPLPGHSSDSVGLVYPADRWIRVFYPGHGYPITDPLQAIDATRQHRLERLQQIKDALATGVARDADALVDAVYVDIDPALREAALRSVQAQLVYLDEG